MDKFQIHDYLDKQINFIKSLNESSEKINQIYDNLLNARNSKNNVFLMGNGGSASTASHFTADLLKTSILENENRFSAFSLVDNIPVILAWANDESYENIFLGQLKNLLKQGDIVIGFSGSGNSKNVIKAFEYANQLNSITISLTGGNGGKLSKISKYNLNINDNDMLTIETGHLLICHLLTTLIRSNGKPMFEY
ncbi:MAG: phosphoheptose isomerase [Thaumarchaeota archaeon]|jgi:D-sedoheptulose 7-phosphate isomerase|nr:MAG: phosphoheptose isomerase [Nitrososphaerota archaeon]